MRFHSYDWMYEDNLPKSISDEDYDWLYKFSKVDGVRLFPRCCRNRQFKCKGCSLSYDKDISWFGCRACWYDDGSELVLERRREAELLKKKSDEAIEELCQMLYKDLTKSGNTPQEALDRIIPIAFEMMR